VTEEQATVDTIIEASNYPISIIAVGVGDGPWNILEKFDNQLPRRKFDNFRFVDYHKATGKSKAPDTAFALQALMEIPDQYKKIRELGYLGAGSSCPQERKLQRLSNCPVQRPSRSLGGGSPARSAKPSPFRHRISNISC